VVVQGSYDVDILIAFFWWRMANIEAGEWVQVAIIMFVDSKFGGSFLRYPERFR
jgi:hypothetical protein